MESSSRNLIIRLRNERNFLFSRNPLKRLGLFLRGLTNQLTVGEKVHLDKYAYPHYAYGIYVSCLQAKALGHSRVTVIEFGVAGGNGLLAMERAAIEIGNECGIVVDVIGVDQGNAGLPHSNDARDMVYWFRPGAYAMNEDQLKSKLSGAKLILGDIAKLGSQLKEQIKAPIGFCSLDMDFYSSTMAALAIFESADIQWLPRVILYADDIFGFDDLNIMGECVGEELAFADFNRANPNKQICPIRGLRHKRPRPAMWNEKMYAMHDLSHPDQNKPINPLQDNELAGLLALKP